MIVVNVMAVVSRAAAVLMVYSDVSSDVSRHYVYVPRPVKGLGSQRRFGDLLAGFISLLNIHI